MERISSLSSDVLFWGIICPFFGVAIGWFFGYYVFMPLCYGIMGTGWDFDPSQIKRPLILASSINMSFRDASATVFMALFACIGTVLAMYITVQSRKSKTGRVRRYRYLIDDYDRIMGLNDES